MAHQADPGDSKRVGVTHVEAIEHPDTYAVTGARHDPIVQDFPEGGFRAWASVVGAAFCLFVGGVEYSFGVYLSYYTTHFLQHQTVSQISWIGSCAAFIHSLVGLLVGKLYDDGWFRQLILLGSFLHVFCFMMLSLCTKYWQFWLAQGLGMGLATGILYQPALAIVSQHFERHRSLAMGIVMAGASIGGVLFPIIANNLFEKVGFGWAVRVQAFLMLVLLTLANLLMTTRLPAHKLTGRIEEHREAIKDDVIAAHPDDKLYRINYRTFFDAAFLTTTTGCFLIQIGTGLPYAYITLYATLSHISPGLQFYLLPITFAGSAIGSPFWAQIADRIGVFNVVIVTTVISAGLEWSILGATTDASAVVVAALYGFMAAGYQSLQGPLYATLSNTVLEIGHRMGFGFAVIGVATLISSPIQGALLGSNPLQYKWWKPILFSTLCLLIGCVLLTVARALLIRRRNVSVKFGWVARQ